LLDRRGSLRPGQDGRQAAGKNGLTVGMMEQADLHSIGDVAKATGISVDTIRVWERRYGRPVPVRIPSGHRRYTGEHIRWLRRVAEALARGNRPAKVVKLSEEQLDTLLSPIPEVAEGAWLPPIMQAVRDGRGDRVVSLVRKAARKQSPIEFIAGRVASLVTEIGRAWADGQIDVRHEHLASEVLEDVLRDYRTGMKEAPRGPVLVLTTLPEETHRLGLQMAAIVARAAGARVRILGADTPLDEITAAATELKAQVVAISVSLATGGVKTDRTLAKLRAELPEKIRLVVGGKGARGVRRGPQGVEYALDFAAFEQLVLDLSSSKPRRSK
jgi:methanogenic corrinoid protein MtbC1